MQFSRILFTCVLSATIVLAAGGRAFAQPARPDQLKPDEAAAVQLLNAGRQAFNERRYDQAADRFRQFLQQFPSHREAGWARFGLGVSLIELPQRDYKTATEMLAGPAGDGAFPMRPLAAFYQGTALRGLGLAALNDAAARPGEAAQLRAAANQQFTAAERAFASAGEQLEQKLKAAPPSTQPDKAAGRAFDADYAARARLSQCEMLIRLGKAKEALPIATRVMEQAAAQGGAKPTAEGGCATYLAGYAQFLLADYQGAGKLLSRLAPFDQEFGLHGRYLLARSHHLAGDAPEAAVQYAAVLADYETAKKAAQQRLGNPAAMTAEQLAFAQSLVNGPPPDCLVRATFYLGVLLAEQGRFADALTRFTTVQTQFAKSPLAPEAQARAGLCLLQTRDFAKATAVLSPLLDNAAAGDLACWWLARTTVASADATNAVALEQATRAALDLYRRGADRAAQRAALPAGAEFADAAAKPRRADMLMDLADAQQSIKLYKDAAATYQAVMTENASPDRVEEAFQRQVTALHLAGMYRESEALATKFIATYPKSLLMPAVMFRSAENAYMLATAAASATPAPAPATIEPMWSDAAGRYDKLLKQFPDFEQDSMARQGLAACQYRLGKFAEAAKTLAGIPEADRLGELAAASYVQADCLIRTLPPEGEDALQAARVLEQLEQAGKLLEGFVSAAPKAPQLPDAMLKLGLCFERSGALLADPVERSARLNRARETFEKLLQQFPQSPAGPPAILERAKCLAMLGNPGGAIAELAKLQAEQFRDNPVAPLAALRQLSLMRAAGQAQQAAAFAQQVRGFHEAALLADPARSDLAAAIQYEHAVALRESGKPADARPIFENIVKQFAASVHAANSTWRLAQIRREELAAAVASARATLTRPGLTPEAAGAATKAMSDAQTAVQQLAASLQAGADAQAKVAPGAEPHLRMLYESAWCLRTLAETELEVAANQVRQQQLAAAVARIGKTLPQGSPPPGIRPPEVSAASLPAQPSEALTRQQYEKLIAAKPDSELANLARYELADMLAQRNDLAGACELLAGAMEHNPSPELADQVRLKLATLLLAQGPDKLDAALAQAQRVGKRPEDPLYAPARLVEAEVRIARKDWPKAVELLAPFRDNGPLTNRPNISDRALLRLGQSYAELKQFDPARQAYRLLTQRFPTSDFVEDAFFGIGWTLQQQKQFDPAVASYAEVTRRTAAEVAARAQLQSGLCRAEQARWQEAATALLQTALAYDYPDLSARARFEAANAYVQLKQPGEAIKLYQQIVAEHPKSEWCEQAKKKLGEVKP